MPQHRRHQTPRPETLPLPRSIFVPNLTPALQGILQVLLARQKDLRDPDLRVLALTRPPGQEGAWLLKATWDLTDDTDDRA